MASKEENNFTKSETVILYGDVGDAIPPDPSPSEQSWLLQGSKDLKRVVLDIDLNVTSIADEDVEFPAANHGGMQVNGCRAWDALLEAAEMAWAEYEEFPKDQRQKKIGAPAPAPAVLRLRRERAAALPNKYRDSVMDYTVEAAIIATKRKSFI